MSGPQSVRELQFGAWRWISRGFESRGDGFSTLNGLRARLVRPVVERLAYFTRISLFRPGNVWQEPKTSHSWYLPLSVALESATPKLLALLASNLHREHRGVSHKLIVR